MMVVEMWDSGFTKVRAQSSLRVFVGKYAVLKCKMKASKQDKYKKGLI